MIGRIDSGNGYEYLVASESVALDTLGFQIVRDVAPGRGGIHRRRRQFHSAASARERPRSIPCIFEYVYLARPDSLMDGVSVYETRLHMGEQLAAKIRTRVFAIWTSTW